MPTVRSPRLTWLSLEGTPCGACWSAQKDVSASNSRCMVASSGRAGGRRLPDARSVARTDSRRPCGRLGERGRRHSAFRRAAGFAVEYCQVWLTLVGLRRWPGQALAGLPSSRSGRWWCRCDRSRVCRARCGWARGSRRGPPGRLGCLPVRGLHEPVRSRPRCRRRRPHRPGRSRAAGGGRAFPAVPCRGREHGPRHRLPVRSHGPADRRQDL
jgi:hypothetical protein